MRGIDAGSLCYYGEGVNAWHGMVSCMVNREGSWGWKESPMCTNMIQNVSPQRQTSIVYHSTIIICSQARMISVDVLASEKELVFDTEKYTHVGYLPEMHSAF